MKIEYDPDKAAANPIKHDGVTFDEARFITLGMSEQARVLIVVWTIRGDTIRLISSWKATQPQRKSYERQF